MSICAYHYRSLMSYKQVKTLCRDIVCIHSGQNQTEHWLLHSVHKLHRLLHDLLCNYTQYPKSPTSSGRSSLSEPRWNSFPGLPASNHVFCFQPDGSVQQIFNTFREPEQAAVDGRMEGCQHWGGIQMHKSQWRNHIWTWYWTKHLSSRLSDKLSDIYNMV